MEGTSLARPEEMPVGDEGVRGPGYFMLESSFAFACWNSSSVKAP